MRRHLFCTHIFFFTSLLLWIACNPNDTSNQQYQAPTPDQLTHISLSQPVEVNGKVVDPNNIEAPLQISLVNNLRTYQIESTKRLIGQLKTAPFPQQLPRKVKGSPPIAAVDSMIIEGVAVPSSYPIPSEAMPMQKKDGARTNIRYLDVYQGMNSPSIYDILEDKRGNIWFATVGGGISKYDGHRFFHFTTEHGLSYNIVKCLLKDSEGNIWIGTLGGGLNKYDGDKFIHFTKKQGLRSDHIFSLLEDRNGSIWVGTDQGGIHLLSATKNGQHEILYNFPSGVEYAFNNILCMEEDREGNIWMGTWDGAMRYLPDPEYSSKGKFEYFTSSEGLLGRSVRSILEDQYGNIWFGTGEQGITIYQKSKQILTYLGTSEGLSHPIVYDMEEDSKGNIWAGMDGGGINKISLSDSTDIHTSFPNITHFDTKNGLSHDNVLTLMNDRSGNIWAGTWGGGVNKFTPSSIFHFSTKDGLPSNDFRAVITGKDSSLWIGTWGDGVFHYEFSDNPSIEVKLTQYSTKEGLSLDNILSLLEDRNGNLWIGTAGGGATFFDQKAQVFTHFTGLSGLSGYGVNILLEDRAGNIWLGIEGGGVTKYIPDPIGDTHFIHFTTDEGLPHNSVSSLLEDHKGNIWIGTKGGLVCFTPSEEETNGKFKYLTQKEGLANNFVVSLIEDASGYLWIGTWGGGLQRLMIDETTTEGELLTLNMDSGLNNDWVMAMAEDQVHNIWVNTLKGFSILKPIKENSANLSLPSTKYAITNLGEAEGLIRTGFWWNNLSLDQQNNLWWGTAEGLAVLDVDEFTIPNNPPEISLNTIQVNQQFIDYRKLNDPVYLKKLTFADEIRERDSVISFQNYPSSLSLPYDLNHLTFHFSATDWRAPQKIVYSYEMEGLGNTTQVKTQSNNADFFNLPYGNYIFKVKARSGTGDWSKTITYPFRIRPPWWHTWWARLLYACVLIAIIYWGYRYQLKRQLAIEESRRLKEMDEFKTRFFTNITHEFRTPITVIMGMSQHIKGHSRHKNLIRRNSQRLLQLVNQLLDLSKLEAGQMPMKLTQQNIIPYLKYLTESFQSLAETRDIALRFYTNTFNTVMDYDAEYIQQIMTNLLTNALKFTEADGTVSVQISQIGDKNNPELNIQVIDQGAGIPSEDIPYIFDRFYQSQSATNTQARGTGVGLALVKELTEKMDGRIGVASEISKGTSFTLSLPIRNNAPLPTLEDSILEESESNSVNIRGIGGKDDEKLVTILIIEDNIDISTYLEECLAPTYHILKAFDGKSGLETALNQVPDIIITDVMMPEMDGHELCRHIKSDRITSHIPVIMLTAKASDEERLEGLEYGADVYLTKPFNEQELHIRIRNLLDIQQKWQERFQQTSSPSPKKVETIEEKFLREAHQLIIDHLDNSEYGVSQFADDLAVSRSQLHRKLKALTGFSATQFMNDIRLTAAHQMLKSGKINVADTAYAAGFEHPNYFTKLYRQKFGQTPSETLR